MLEAVEQREDDSTRDRLRSDPFERVVEVVGLDGDEQESDGSLETLDRFGVRHDRRLAVDQREPGRADRGHRALRTDADCTRPRSEHPADPPRAEDGDRCGHASSGSTTRFTYCVSE